MIYGRYHVVRNYWCPTGRLSEPYVLDRHERCLYPYRVGAAARAEWEARRSEESARREARAKWERLKHAVCDAATAGRRRRLAARLLADRADCARLCAVFGKAEAMPLRLLFEQVWSGAATTSLNNNYVAGTSGNAIAARFLVPAGGKTINNLYFFVSSYTGTAANVNDLNVEVRPEASAGASTPSTATLTDSATKDPASATGWVKATGLTASLTALARYFFIVGDADGSGTDFAVVQNRSVWGEVGGGAVRQYFSRWTTALTTGGWASGNSTPSNAWPQLVAGFSDSTSYGSPFTASTSPANNSQQRGLYIDSTALASTIPVFGMVWTNTSGNISGMKIFQGTTAPNGTAYDTSTDLFYDQSAGRTGCLTASGTPVSLTTGSVWRLVATYGGNTTSGPQRMDIGTGADATLASAMPGAGLLYWTQDGGGSTWANDLTTSLPAVGLLLDGFAAAAGGGGLLLPRSMGGGLV